MDSLQLSIEIGRSPDDVYDYVSDSKNMPQWAEGVDPTLVTFAERNAFGVLDHTVTLPGGVLTVPMRVLPLGDHSELVFTLRRGEGMSDAAFAEDRAAVENELASLKAIMEG